MVRRNRGRSASTGLNPSHGPLVSTYQTRIADYGDVEPTHGEAALAAYAELYGRVQRKLFADFSAGKLPASLKRCTCSGTGSRLGCSTACGFRWRARCRRCGRPWHSGGMAWSVGLAGLSVRLPRLSRWSRWAQVHHKRRRLANLRHRLAGLEADFAAGRVRLCFGSKRLWRKQHHLEDQRLRQP